MSNQPQRINLLDEIRGFAIICMVFFHAFYTMAYIFGWGAFDILLNFFTPAEPYFAALFIFISGICSHLSHSNAMRGAKLAWIAAGLTLVTWVMDALMGIDGTVIWFGILHLLSASMLFYAAVSGIADKIPAWVTVAVCALLFAATYNLQYGTVGIGVLSLDVPDKIANEVLLFPFSTSAKSFYSADYFPIFPWLFIFMAGTAVGRRFKQGRIPQWFYPAHVPPIAFCGRHSLIIYLAHQPVIYLLCAAVSAIFGI